MKASFAILSIYTVLLASVDAREPLFRIPILGFTDIDAIDYGEGYASGFFGKDVRSQWSTCINGFPEIIEEFTDFFAVSNNVVIFSKHNVFI